MAQEALLESRLYDEVDRQLEHVRATADSLATRSGVLVSAVALGASLLAARIESGDGVDLRASCLALLVSAALGALTLCARLRFGPEPSELRNLPNSLNIKVAVTALRVTKTSVLEANRHRVLVMTVALYAQAAATVIAFGTALYSVVLQ